MTASQSQAPHTCRVGPASEKERRQSHDHPSLTFPLWSAHIALAQPNSSAQSSSVHGCSSFSRQPLSPKLRGQLLRIRLASPPLSVGPFLSGPMPSSPALLLLTSSSLLPEHADRLSTGTERAEPFSSTVVRSLPLSLAAATARERRARPPLQGVCRRLSLKRT